MRKQKTKKAKLIMVWIVFLTSNAEALMILSPSSTFKGHFTLLG